MFRVVNVSKRAVTVGGVRIAPLETQIFNESELSDTVMDRINGLISIGVLKMYKMSVVEVVETPSPKKSNKRK